MNAARPRSIHHQRRWFYALWVILLLLSATALVLWETPKRHVEASMVLRVAVPDAPAGTRVRAWIGPRGQWRGMDAGGPCLVQAVLQPDGSASFPLVHVRIARRRWGRDYIPRGTWDLAQVQFIPPDGPPRYYTLPLDMDLRSGLLRPGWRLLNQINTHWASLGTSVPPDRLP